MKIAQSITAVEYLTIRVATAVPKTLAESLEPKDQPKNIPDKICQLNIDAKFQNYL